MLVYSLSKWLQKEAVQLSKESIIHRNSFVRKYIFDDKVKVLQTNPLGMFFYNQRAIFFVSGFFFLSILFILERVYKSNIELHRTLQVLTICLFADVLITLFF